MLLLGLLALPGVASAELLIGDLTGDGSVDAEDEPWLKAAYGTACGDPEFEPAADLNGDGVVDHRDVFLSERQRDTGGTLCNAVHALKEAGATDVYAAATHPVLSGKAYDRIDGSDLKTMLVTDTLPLKRESSKIEVASVAPIFAEAVKRTFKYQSISSLFDVDKS